MATKLGGIDFDDCILDSLRDGRLVVFAGAGVSMGPPANLASFWKLTCDIAQGTGLTPSEPLDRFLGHLHHRNVAVHERAAQLLSPEGSAPNELHHGLLRLFRTSNRVRLVTTNFDLHFETAANTLFGAVPEVYRAPALPRGYDFSGIVHLHGALPTARGLVLTDSDFGRAYLTEGWARRFLVDVFRCYTVLFVGYSHKDVVMNYLARALPADNLARRFALTDEDGSWELLGITPIRFLKGGVGEEFISLYKGVQLLAERTARGALDWQSRLAEIGGSAPPTDEEAISEVEQALRETYTLRFLLNVARDAKWLWWLHARGHLDALFATSDLGERDKLLLGWLTMHFVIEHPYEMFEVIAAHGLRLNNELWNSIGRELGTSTEKQLEKAVLKRWLSILIASAPVQPDHYVFMWLAERCASEGCVELTLKTFMAMSKYQLQVKRGFEWPDNEAKDRRRLNLECPLLVDHWPLNEVWSNYLKPHLSQILQPLLLNVTLRLEEMHEELSVWEMASREWDPVSYGRSAIEAHEQDQYPEAIDVLIDAARDALELLAANSAVLLYTWIERLSNSDAPLLRRLAIHAVSVHPELSHEDRLHWILERAVLHELSVHHEVHRTVALSYVNATDKVRKAIVEAILAHTLPATDYSSAEERTDRLRFDWLSWLLLAKSDCVLVSTALAPIRLKYPDWQLSEHPDLTHWMGSSGWVGSESPWTVEQLLARHPQEQLNDLLSFIGNRFEGPSREGLLANVHEACKQNSNWAFALAQVLSEKELWSSDLWSALIRGLQEAELVEEGWRILLTLLSNQVLLATHSYDISRLIYSLVKDGGKPYANDLLEQANTIAISLWEALEVSDKEEEFDDWLNHAINRPAGVIVKFWINGLSLFVHGKSRNERVMPEYYRHWFTLVVQNPNSNGGMGRSVLTSQTAFLFGLDETWTCQHIIPLFSDPDRQKFNQAWDGFLVHGQLKPALVDALLPAFTAAMPRLVTVRERQRARFIQYYTSLAVFYVSDPAQYLLPIFFQHSSLKDRLKFASHLGHILRQMQQPAKHHLWNGWLCRYWESRLQGVLSSLDDAEIQKMLDWLPHLGDIYPEAVALAIRSPVIRIEQSQLIYELRKSELVTRFAAETAELLIYLANSINGYNGSYLDEINLRLPEIPAEVRRRLDEAFARAGIVRAGR